MDFKYTIGCETTGNSAVEPSLLLRAFRDLDDPEATLLLINRRSEKSDFSIRNFIEANHLQDRVTCLQYYGRGDYQSRRELCRLWIRKHTPAELITPESLREHVDRFAGEQVVLSDGKKHVLFFTGFHPYKEEGQGAYMRLWLDSLVKTGHEVHLVHYQNDLKMTPPEARSRAAADFRHYHEIAVVSRLVGYNENGLNIDLDDWCGREALKGVEHLVDQYEFDSCLVIYPFFSAVFRILPPGTRKILVTPDSFSDRNRRMLEQGYSVARWVSLTGEGEKEACLRADVIVAIKAEEAAYFRALTEGQREVAIVSSLHPLVDFQRRELSGRLRIGYFASDTYVNRECVMEFLRRRAGSRALASGSEVILAGGFCGSLDNYRGESELKDRSVRVLGRLEDLADLYRETDLIINPDKGGTGLKIKTLEPMYYGMPVVSTRAGAGGLGSVSRFHQASGLDELVSLLEEVVADPSLLADLSRSSREITERLNRESLRGVEKVLGCGVESLEPGHIAEDEAGIRGMFPGRIQSPAGGNGEIPKISVVLPFFNAERNLAGAVSSVTGHDYRNLELILVDDGSNDDSGRIADDLARQDSRIRVLRHSENQGAGPARNTGVLNAFGEYLFFLDSDDILRRGALRLLLGKAVEEDVGLVIGSCNQIDEYGNYGEYDRDRDLGRDRAFGRIDGVEALRRSLNVEEGTFLPVRPWGMLIDLQMYRNTGLFFPPGEYEDLSVIPFLYHQAGTVVYLRDIVVTYRIRKGSVTRSPLNPAKVQRYRGLWELISGRIGEYGLEDYRRDFKVFHVGHLLWLLSQGPVERGVIESVAGLISGEMDLRRGSASGEPGLHYLVDYISGILETSGLERDFELWKNLVACLGEEALAGYFRQRIHELDC